MKKTTMPQIPIEIFDANGALLTTAVAALSHSSTPTVGWVVALTPKGPRAKGPEAKAFSPAFLITQGDVSIRFPHGQTVQAIKVHNQSRKRVILRIPDLYSAIVESAAKS